MKLLCFGDLHLGAGGQYPGRLNDQRRVLAEISHLAHERAVEGVLFAGDAFEGPGIPPEQLQVFADFVAVLRVAEIPMLAITGNGKHDAAVRDTNGMAIFEHVPGIEVYSQPGVHLFAGCSVAVLPWVHPGRLIARAGRDVPRDEVNAIAADLLVDVARDMLVRSWPNTPKILLGHWSVSGTALPAGLPVDELREPVLPVDALEALGYDAVVFGHIHRTQPIGKSGFYTGSPMPLNFGEEHVEHGVTIIEFSPDVFEGVETEFVPVHSPRFVTVEIDDIEQWVNDPIDTPFPDSVADALLRIRFTATTDQMRRIDVADMRDIFLELGARVVKVEPTIIREQRARVAGVDEQLDELAAVDLWLTANAIDPTTADVMRGKTRQYLEAIA